MVLNNDQYSIQKFNPQYLSSLAKLLDNSFHISIRQKDKLIFWKLLHPIHKGKTITYIALDQKKNVVSHYTNIPINVSRTNKTYKSLVCVDMATDIKHRGRKLISILSEKVYDKVNKENYDFSLGFSNDEGVKVDKNAKEYGYKLVGRFVRYFKIVITRKEVPYKLIEIKNFSKEMGPISTTFFALKKSYSFLTWRYVEKPSKEYDLYKIVSGDNETIGFVVLRFIRRKCYIYDIVLQNFSKETMLTVLRAIENKALDNGVRIIIYNVLDNTFWKELFNRYKYFKRTHNRVNYFLTIKIHKPLVEQEEILNKENWFLMNGDII